jgi:hypothetical protein
MELAARTPARAPGPEADGLSGPSRARVPTSNADAFSSRWSFYEAGHTSWMEEIRYRRLSGSR